MLNVDSNIESTGWTNELVLVNVSKITGKHHDFTGRKRHVSTHAENQS